MPCAEKCGENHEPEQGGAPQGESTRAGAAGHPPPKPHPQREHDGHETWQRQQGSTINWIAERKGKRCDNIESVGAGEAPEDSAETRKREYEEREEEHVL